MGQYGTTTSVILTSANIPRHKHTYSKPSATVGIANGGNSGSVSYANTGVSNNTAAVGKSTPLSIMPENFSLNYCIKN